MTEYASGQIVRIANAMELCFEEDEAYPSSAVENAIIFAFQNKERYVRAVRKFLGRLESLTSTSLWAKTEEGLLLRAKDFAQSVNAITTENWALKEKIKDLEKQVFDLSASTVTEPETLCGVVEAVPS